MTDDTYFLIVYADPGAVVNPGSWYVAKYGLFTRRRYLAPEYSETGPFSSEEEALLNAYALGAKRVWKAQWYCKPWYMAWETTRRMNATESQLAAAAAADRGFVALLEEIETVAETAV